MKGSQPKRYALTNALNYRPGGGGVSPPTSTPPQPPRLLQPPSHFATLLPPRLS